MENVGYFRQSTSVYILFEIRCISLWIVYVHNSNQLHVILILTLIRELECYFLQVPVWLKHELEKKKIMRPIKKYTPYIQAIDVAWMYNYNNYFNKFKDNIKLYCVDRFDVQIRCLQAHDMGPHSTAVVTR